MAKKSNDNDKSKGKGERYSPGSRPRWHAGSKGYRASSGFPMVCPSCSSDDVTSQPPSRGFRQWHCNACANDWSESV